MELVKMNDEQMERYQKHFFALCRKYLWIGEREAIKAIRKLSHLMFGLGYPVANIRYWPEAKVVEITMRVKGFKGKDSVAIYVREDSVEYRWMGGFARFRSVREAIEWVG